MAKPKRVANKPAASGRIAAGAPAPAVFSSAPPKEAPAPKEDEYKPQPMEYDHPDAISPDGSFHIRAFDIAEEIRQRISAVKAGQSVKNKESSTVARKAAPAEISLNKAQQLIQNSGQAHRAGDSWTATADMRDAVHHITNAVNYLNSGEGWGGEKRSHNAANFWAADSRRTDAELGKGPSLTNVHNDLTNLLNGYLQHVKKAVWPKKNHISNQGTDFSPEQITPNSEFEGYGEAPRTRTVATKKVDVTKQEAVNAAGKILKPKYNPVGNLATVPAVLRREYAKQVLPHWTENNPGKTFVGSDAHLHPELYAKANGIDLKYPSRALFSATGDPFHLIVPSMLEKEGQLGEEDIKKIEKKESQATERERSKSVYKAPLDNSEESDAEVAAKITGAVREKPEAGVNVRGSRKPTAAELLPHVPEAAAKLKKKDIAGAARAVWEAHYSPMEPIPSDASLSQVKQWHKVQDDAFKAHPASQNPAGFLDAHGYKVPGVGTRKMEFDAGQVK